MSQKIIRNSAKCTHCGDEIESKHRHHFVFCKCGIIFVDGGLDYLRRGFKVEGDLVETSIVEEADDHT